MDPSHNNQHEPSNSRGISPHLVYASRRGSESSSPTSTPAMSLPVDSIHASRSLLFAARQHLAADYLQQLENIRDIQFRGAPLSHVRSDTPVTLPKEIPAPVPVDRLALLTSAATAIDCVESEAVPSKQRVGLPDSLLQGSFLFKSATRPAAGLPGLPKGTAASKATGRSGNAFSVNEQHSQEDGSAFKPWCGVDGSSSTSRITSASTGSQPLLPATGMPGAGTPFTKAASTPASAPHQQTSFSSGGSSIADALRKIAACALPMSGANCDDRGRGIANDCSQSSRLTGSTFAIRGSEWMPPRHGTETSGLSLLRGSSLAGSRVCEPGVFTGIGLGLPRRPVTYAATKLNGTGGFVAPTHALRGSIDEEDGDLADAMLLIAEAAAQTGSTSGLSEDGDAAHAGAFEDSVQRRGRGSDTGATSGRKRSRASRSKGAGSRSGSTAGSAVPSASTTPSLPVADDNFQPGALVTDGTVSVLTRIMPAWRSGSTRKHHSSCSGCSGHLVLGRAPRRVGILCCNFCASSAHEACVIATLLSASAGGNEVDCGESFHVASHDGGQSGPPRLVTSRVPASSILSSAGESATSHVATPPDTGTVLAMLSAGASLACVQRAGSRPQAAETARWVCGDCTARARALDVGATAAASASDVGAGLSTDGLGLPLDASPTHAHDTLYRRSRPSTPTGHSPLAGDGEPGPDPALPAGSYRGRSEYDDDEDITMALPHYGVAIGTSPLLSPVLLAADARPLVSMAPAGNGEGSDAGGIELASTSTAAASAAAISSHSGTVASNGASSTISGFGSPPFAAALPQSADNAGVVVFSQPLSGFGEVISQRSQTVAVDGDSLPSLPTACGTTAAGLAVSGYLSSSGSMLPRGV